MGMRTIPRCPQLGSRRQPNGYQLYIDRSDCQPWHPPGVWYMAGTFACRALVLCLAPRQQRPWAITPVTSIRKILKHARAATTIRRIPSGPNRARPLISRFATCIVQQ